jgi:putative restriction endonuclease
MTADAQTMLWLERLGNLNPERAKKKTRGLAPHKPLLLLVLLDLVEEGRLKSAKVELSAELSFRFGIYWKVVSERRRTSPDVRLPFFHLKTSGFWTPLDAEGRVAQARSAATVGVLDPDFFRCLHDPEFRRLARRKLVAKWFEQPAERVALYTMLGLPVPAKDTADADAKLGEASAARERGREGRFRSVVLPAYNYTCALTGYRVNTLGEYLVDAARIRQFKRGGGNEPQNGIALAKNSHWLFDRGLWSISDDYRVIVTTASFEEAGPDAFLLRNMAGRPIRLPERPHLYPDRRHLAWHREHIFRK